MKAQQKRDRSQQENHFACVSMKSSVITESGREPWAVWGHVEGKAEHDLQTQLDFEWIDNVLLVIIQFVKRYWKGHLFTLDLSLQLYEPTILFESLLLNINYS